MYRILNIDPDYYSEKARKILRSIGTLTEKKLSRSQLLKEIDNYDVLLLRFSHTIDKDVFAASKKLKIVAANVTGTDHIDVLEAECRGIQVISLKGEYEFLKTVTATAELTWGLLLSVIRNIPAAYSSVKRKHWNRDRFIGHELYGKQLGVLGFGRIGTKIAEYGLAFGMNVYVFDKEKKQTRSCIKVCKNIKEILKNTDVLSIHVSLTEESRTLIGRKELSFLPTGAVLINTSRGAILDEEALVEALDSGRLAGAGLDVLAGENKKGFAKNNILVSYARTHNNLIITPHIGGTAWESWEKTEVFIAEKVKASLAGV